MSISHNLDVLDGQQLQDNESVCLIRLARITPRLKHEAIPENGLVHQTIQEAIRDLVQDQLQKKVGRLIQTRLSLTLLQEQGLHPQVLPRAISEAGRVILRQNQILLLEVGQTIIQTDLAENRITAIEVIPQAEEARPDQVQVLEAGVLHQVEAEAEEVEGNN